MELLTSFLLAVGLAMDAFAVSIGAGTSGQVEDLRSKTRLAFHFGLFQGGMAFIGWLAGRQIAELISRVDHWVAFSLLLWVGGRMVRNSFRNGDESKPGDPTRGGSLVMLSIATSIDALAIGLSLAIIDGSILVSSVIIGVTSFILSVAGYLLGDRLGHRFGKRMELLGGLILIGIGIRVLVSHLWGL